ncbi:hypothetical protein LZ32DRAFT_612163 [Colletotrichum eremochloae]|nr:hypothetical protein LZ32DRAFT_612163 [Colletotrichum eremochloae]
MCGLGRVVLTCYCLLCITSPLQPALRLFISDAKDDPSSLFPNSSSRPGHARHGRGGGENNGSNTMEARQGKARQGKARQGRAGLMSSSLLSATRSRPFSSVPTASQVTNYLG